MYYNIYSNICDKYRGELEKLSAPMRESMIFKHTVEDMPLYLRTDDAFAGWYGYEEPIPKAAPVPFERIAVMSEEERETRRRLAQDLRIEPQFTSAHTCIDYGTIVKRGLADYAAKVDRALEAHPDDECLRAMRVSLDAAGIYAARYAALAKERMAAEPRFEKVYQALCRVPMQPAENFLDAVQCVWLMHTLIPMAEKSWASISIGRIDQYLYPYYRKAVEDGWPQEEIRGILKHLFRLLDSYGDGACAMNIGGMDADGNDMMNELSELLIDVEKEMSLRAPIFAVRVNPKTPAEILDSLIDFDLFKIGQPTFYGELPCRKAVAGRGIDMREAAEFSANSCMGLILAGYEFADMWGIKFNMHMPLELAVNHGQPFGCEMPISLKTEPKDIYSFECLMEQYGAYLRELVEIASKYYALAAEEYGKNMPDPLLSAITEGCVENRRDRATGAKYNTVTMETLGLINTCDALEAVRGLVFEQGKYTLEQLVTAAKRNYASDDAILRDIRKCVKYGMNEEGSNELSRTLSRIVSDACKSQRRGNMMFLPSLHTIDSNVDYGRKIGATLDGRLAGEPVNRNADPSALVQKLDHTSHILSAASILQTEFSGGQPIDLYFDKSWFDSRESRDKIKSLILTYFDLGGLQFQVNSADIELLEKADAHPEEYPQLIVRKGGYSVRFCEMGAPVRRDFIEAAKKERI